MRSAILSNDRRHDHGEVNAPGTRIASALYGGDQSHRLRQEKTAGAATENCPVPGLQAAPKWQQSAWRNLAGDSLK